MKKIILVLLTSIIIFGFNVKEVFAATGTFSISSSSTVTVGNNVSVTFKASASKIFYWQYYVSYDASRLKLVSGSTTIQGEADSITTGVGTVTKTLTFKALKSGSAYVRIARGDADMNIDVNGTSITYTTATRNITLADVVPKSTNNNVSSITIAGATLNPTFSQDVTTYTVDLANTITSINIAATAADAKGSVSGTGDFPVIEGDNKFVVTGIAEDGSTKAYNITVTVSEKNPINVKIDNNSYTVVRNSGKVTIPTGYEETKIKINDNDIAAFTSKITKLTLVALKDSKANYVLATYKDGKYSLYSQISSKDITICIVALPKGVDKPSGYKEYTLTIDKLSFDAWKANKTSKFYVVYGINTATGKAGFYQYDSTDKTLQRFNTEQSDLLSKSINNYIIALIAIGIVTFASIAMCIFQLLKFNKLNNKVKKAKERHLEESKKAAS